MSSEKYTRKLLFQYPEFTDSKMARLTCPDIGGADMDKERSIVRAARRDLLKELIPEHMGLVLNAAILQSERDAAQSSEAVAHDRCRSMSALLKTSAIQVKGTRDRLTLEVQSDLKARHDAEILALQSDLKDGADRETDFVEAVRIANSRAADAELLLSDLEESTVAYKKRVARGSAVIAAIAVLLIVVQIFA